ncbi:MAG: cobalt ECF transporter T component CbiQ [Desulfobulbaceae bacterium]|nr:cobalt ECF transporter T component CbiQ [Desulfobulbaceae bacterium]
MPVVDKNFFDIRYLDTLAQGNSWLHRLDPRAKLITTLIFIITVVSFDKYTISALLPFVLYPVVLIGSANLPLSYLLNKLLIVAPFAVLIGLFNPLIDTSVHLHIGSFGITGGWISLVSLVLRFVLTVGSVLVFIALTSFNGLCVALEKLRVPTIFIVQLLFLYRYIFVLLEETMRMSRAQALRTFNGSGLGLKTYGMLVGHLLLRTLNRAERIHCAMRCRGFDGHMHLGRPAGIGKNEVFFVLFWSSLFLAMRLYNVPLLLETAITEIMT